MGLFKWIDEIVNALLDRPPTKIDHTNDWIGYLKRCPWPEDLSIDVTSWIGGGEFSSVKGKAYHTISCSADGPNPGTSFHHGYIGYWKFDGFEERNLFVLEIHNRIREITGVDAPIYTTSEQRNQHAGWCMKEPGDEKPEGTPITEPLIEFETYDEEKD